MATVQVVGGVLGLPSPILRSLSTEVPHLDSSPQSVPSRPSSWPEFMAKSYLIIPLDWSEYSISCCFSKVGLQLPLGTTPNVEDLYSSSARLCDESLADTSIFKLLYLNGDKILPDEFFSDLYDNLVRASILLRRL